MKVLLDYRPALRNRTGVGEYVHRTALALAETASPGDQVALFSSSWKDRLQAPAGGIEVHDARLPVRGLTWMWHRLEWPPVERLTGRIDIVHSPTPLLIPAARAARAVSIFDLFFLDHPGATDAEVRRDYGALAADHARRADLVVTISHTVAEAVVRRFDVDPARIVTAYCGAPAWTAPPEPAADGPVICVGTLEPRKNIAGLLDAWTSLVAGGVRVPLHLAGGAPASAAPELARLAAPPLAGLVQHLGYIPDADRYALYAGARLLVMPSWDEGFGIPVVEAMAAGVPVVCANRGALPEVCGDAAEYVDPADPKAMADTIARVLHSPARLADLRERGLARVRRYSWTDTARTLWSAYAHATVTRSRR